MVVVMVYKVLTDNYTTDKTFEHFYEDRPIEPLDIKAENEKFRQRANMWKEAKKEQHYVALFFIQ